MKKMLFLVATSASCLFAFSVLSWDIGTFNEKISSPPLHSSALTPTIQPVDLKAGDEITPSLVTHPAATIPVPTPKTICSAKKIVVLGSSTPAGYGPSSYSKSWVSMYDAYLKQLNPKHQVINLAVGGFKTYHILPTGTQTPSDRPRPDSTKNITAALALDPQAIIVNMPTNDIARDYALTEIQANYAKIKDAADKAGVPIWFTTTQPRGISSPGILEEFPPDALKKRDDLIALKDWTNAAYGSKALDFWTTIANREDGLIEELYAAYDGIHLNDAGHQILFERVAESGLIEELCQL